MRVDELGVNVFGVPAATVQRRKRSRLLVCSGVAQSVVDSVHSEHDEFVFVYRRPKQDGAARRDPHPVETMNNTAWQRVRREAGRGDLHVHGLRHTAGTRLRDARVAQSTRADIRWHASPTMTQHYSMAHRAELHAAVEKIREDTGLWNESPATLKLAAQAARRGPRRHPAGVPQQTAAAQTLARLGR